MNENGQLLTIRDLANAYNHKEYKLLLNELPKHTKQYLTRKNSNIRFANNSITFCQNQVSILKKCLKEHESTLNNAIQCFGQTSKELDDARKALISAELALSDAQKKVAKARDSFKAISCYHELLKNDISRERSIVDNYNNTLDSAQKVLKEAKHFILVHPSATVSSLSKKIGHGVLLCTKHDATAIAFKKHVDKVISAENHSELVPDDAIKHFKSVEEYTSAVEYINLVLKFLFEGADYETLYNSEGIKYILDSIL